MTFSRKCLRVAMAIVLAVCLTPAAAFAQGEAGGTSASRLADGAESGVGVANPGTENASNDATTAPSEGSAEATVPVAPEATSDGQGSGAPKAPADAQGELDAQAVIDAQEAFASTGMEHDIGTSKLDLKNTDGCSAANPHRVTQTTSYTVNSISVIGGQHYIELGGVNILSNPILVAKGASAHIVLKSGSTNTLYGNSGHAGLEVSEGGSVSIGGTGLLFAAGSDDSAGIGASKGGQCGSIAIEGGDLNVTSTEGVAIGGGTDAKVSISGGRIVASSPSGTSKIGSTNGRVEISGGNILTQNGADSVEDVNGVRNAYLPNSNTRVYQATIKIPSPLGTVKLTNSSYNLDGVERFYNDNTLHVYLPLGKALGTYEWNYATRFTQPMLAEVSADNTAIFELSKLIDISKQPASVYYEATNPDLPLVVYQSDPKPTSNGLTIGGGGMRYVKLVGVNMVKNDDNACIKVWDNHTSAHLELAAGTTNTVENASGRAPGIKVSSQTGLTISGTGSLKASQSNGSNWAAIGGQLSKGNSTAFQAGIIIVESGTVEATGAAGIGGWRANVQIKGGTVTARGTAAAGVAAQKTSMSGGILDAQGAGGPGIGVQSELSSATITITGGVVKAQGSHADYYSGDMSAGKIQIQGGNVEAAVVSVSPLNAACAYPKEMLYPVKLSVAAGSELSGYEVLFARNSKEQPTPFKYNLKGVKANAKGEAWLWLPKGIAKLQKKAVAAADYSLEATEDYALDTYSDDELADAFIAIVMEDGSSIFEPDLSEEFSTQGLGGAFGQVTANTAPVLLRNGEPLAPDGKEEVTWVYSFGPNDEDVCFTWEDLVAEHGTNGALNAGDYGFGLLYDAGEVGEGLGLLSGSFEVTKKELAPSLIADIPAQAIAQGAQAMPAVSVTDGNPSFIKAADYTVTYGANNVAGKAAGSVTVTATEASNYSGSVTKTFDVNVSTTPGSNSNKTTSVNSGSLAKTGDMLGLGIVGLFTVSVVALVGAVLAVRFKRRRN